MECDVRGMMIMGMRSNADADYAVLQPATASASVSATVGIMRQLPLKSRQKKVGNFGDCLSQFLVKFGFLGQFFLKKVQTNHLCLKKGKNCVFNESPVGCSTHFY